MESENRNPLYTTIERILEDAKSKQDHIEKFLYAHRMATIGDFAGRIIHNLNNVLGGILGYSQLLQHELDPSSDAFRQSSIIEQATRRATRLISQLVNLSDNRCFHKGPIDPRKLVEEVVMFLECGFSKNISIHTQYNHESKRIWANSSMMSQVLINLCLNAREAMPSGGTLKIQTELSISQHAMEGKNNSNSHANYAIFKISDTGIGIRNEILPLIFEPFFTIKKPGKGSGLGLTIVKGIVEDHGGEIKVFSKAGEGTTIEVYVPIIKEEDTTDTEEETYVPEDQGQGELIMVVDDEEDLREMAKTIFENKGYKVLLAKDGDDAINIYREHASEIQLVILDMIMPGADGEQVYQEIKATSSGVKIILTSGYVKDSRIQSVLDEGVESFLPKPWDMPDLLKETKRVLKSS